jgi:chromosome segregation ATPase
MLKKLLLVGAGVLLLGGLFFGTSAVSYVSTFVGGVRESVENNVPIEFHLKRARDMVKDLDPEIRNARIKIAKEESELGKLRSRLNGAEQQLAKNESDIQRLNQDLLRGQSTYVYVNKTYSASDVEKDLENRFARYEVKKENADIMRKVIDAREIGLSAAQEKLSEMMTAKQQLGLEIENLQGRLAMVEVAKTASEINIDNSQLARTRDLLDEIEARIQVEESMLDVDGDAPGAIVLDAPESENISERVTKYFNGETAEENLVELD